MAASALSDIAKHTPELAQVVVDTGAVPYLAPLLVNQDAKLKRQVSMREQSSVWVNRNAAVVLSCIMLDTQSQHTFGCSCSKCTARCRRLLRSRRMGFGLNTSCACTCPVCRCAVPLVRLPSTLLTLLRWWWRLRYSPSVSHASGTLTSSCRSTQQHW